MKLGLLSILNEETPLKKFVQKMCPPLGFFYIESYLKKYLPEARVFISSNLESILDWQPDLIGLSSVTENFCIAVKTIEKIKKITPIPVIIGGVHISIIPASLPVGCSLGVIGEGEDTILELLRIFIRDKSFKEDELKNVKGIVYRDKAGQLHITEKRPLINPLDKIPHPKRHFIDPLGITHVITSRGCPFKCVFCSTSNFWSCYRGHSARYVASELKDIMEKVSPPHIKFFDDLFIANKERIKELAKIIIEEKILPPCGYSCFARAELLDHEMMGLLKNIGFTGLAIGVESGSPEILTKLKGNSTVEVNQRALDLCYEYGIHTTCSFVLGMPGETKKDLEMTYDFIMKNEEKISEIEICPIVPFPGTELWDYAEKKGIVSLDMDWSLLEDYSIFTQFEPSKYIYLNDSLPPDEFNRLCKKFLKIYRHFSEKSYRLHSNIFDPNIKKGEGL